MFMKPLLAAGLLALAAAPVQAEILYQGLFIVTSATAACAGQKAVGDLDNAQFHPRGLGNANFSALTRTYHFGGQSYRLDSANFGTAYRKVISEGMGWSNYTASAGDEAYVLFNPVPVITATTNVLTITGKIKNPNMNAASRLCEIGFRAVLQKRVE